MTNRTPLEAIDSPYIVVLGAGAIGGVMAAHLARAGADVAVVDPWYQHVEVAKRAGLTVEGDGPAFTSKVPAFHVDEFAKLGRPIDIAVLSMKAYDAEWGARLLQPYLSDCGVIVVAQNGITEESLSKIVGAERLIGCAITNYPGECFVPGVLKRTPLGSKEPAFTLGELDGRMTPRLENVAKHLAPTGLIKTTDNIWGALYGKLVLNLMSNALGGMTGLTTYGLWTNPDIASIGVLCGEEAIRISDKLGIAMTPVFGRIQPADLRGGAAGDHDAWNRAMSELNQMGRERVGGSENKPSLLQDILKGRRTEIDYLNGFVVTKSQELGFDAPVNRAVSQLLDAVARGELERGPDRITDLRALAQLHRKWAVA